MKFILPIKWIVLSIIVISLVAVLFLSMPKILSFFYNAKNQGNNSGKLVLKEGEQLLESFPATEPIFSKTAGWSSTIFQGDIKGYGEKNGIRYVEIEYLGKDNGINTAKVMISIKEASVPRLKEYKRVDEKFYNDFKLKYVDTVEIFDTKDDLFNNKTPMRLLPEEFMRVYSEGKALSFSILTDYPRAAYRTDKYCDSNGLWLMCITGDLMEANAPDLNKFWRGEKIDEKSILIPNYIYSTLTNSD